MTATAPAAAKYDAVVIGAGVAGLSATIKTKKNKKRKKKKIVQEPKEL